MDVSDLIPHIESLIFASEKPLTQEEITDLINSAFGFMEDKITPEQVDAALQGIVEKYGADFYPFEVKQSGGGWQFLTKKEYHKTVAQLNGEKFLKRLSAAALETLAIIAYKQPITKGEIEQIRGVSADYTIQKLLEKELIIITGRNEQLPGHPLVYTTSKTFMDYFGLNSADDLPRIREVLADQVVEPTVVQHTGIEQSDTLVVTEEGELMDTETGELLPQVNGRAFPSGERPERADTFTDRGEETPELVRDETAAEDGEHGPEEETASYHREEESGDDRADRGDSEARLYIDENEADEVSGDDNNNNDDDDDNEEEEEEEEEEPGSGDEPEGESGEEEGRDRP